MKFPVPMSPNPCRVLVATLGNLDRGDDAIGAVVAQALSERLPPGVALFETGDDLLALMNAWQGYPALICVDALACVGTPGQIFRFDLASDVLPEGFAANSTHALGLDAILSLGRVLAQAPQHIVVYAVAGAQFKLGTAPADAVVAAALQTADRVIEEIARLRAGLQ